jgi:beta-galactosidase
MNRAFGLHYWSNSVFDWEDMPSTIGTINASLRCEFEKFQRHLVTDFLAWQVSIVNEYKKPGQFVTQNFDLEWRGMSNAIQPDVDHFEACQSLDIAGIDIYHATGENLDGVEIGFAGDLARSMKNTNYLVIETQAQSITPSSAQHLVFPNQLRMQAYSHFASGANMVAYWPWHSIHNSAETYWKGLLSHDLEPNPTYNEAKQIGAELKIIGSNIINLKKNNKVAIYFSNESLSAIEKFPIHDQQNYNDIIHKFYELLFKMNIECDFIDHTSENIEKYDLIIVPPLYVASDDELNRFTEYAKNGGQIIFGFKSGFSNENVQVRTARQPGVIRKACGVSYQQFTSISQLPIIQNLFNVDSIDNYASYWAELLVPEGAEVIARYDHPYWKKYAAIVRNSFGKGKITYLGTWPSDAILKEILLEEVKTSDMEISEYQFPIIIRNGVNSNKKFIHYIFNYSQEEQSIRYKFNDGINLLTKEKLNTNGIVAIQPWDLIIVQEL